jgi:hypothetical protein
MDEVTGREVFHFIRRRGTPQDCIAIPREASGYGSERALVRVSLQTLEHDT